MNDFLTSIKPSVLARACAIKLPQAINTNSLDFCMPFVNTSRPAIIAEIKFASPSRGLIYHGPLDPITIAQTYIANGASALSILTEPHYFKGDIESIKMVRQAIPTALILLKDFIMHRAQIAQALHYGANAVLLIVAFLQPSLFIDLYQYTLSLGLTPLIEVNNIQELEIALSVNPKIIGINNRDLKTLKIDLKTSKRLIQSIPKNVHVICASGITTTAQLQEMMTLKFHGFLIGSGLMEHDNPGEALKKLCLGDHRES